MKLELGDRVKRKDDTDFMSGIKVGIVDCEEPHETKHGLEVFVKIPHQGFNSSVNVLVEELEKIEDYKISVSEFFNDISSWLLSKRFDSDDMGEEHAVEAYDKVIKKIIDLRSHIGY